MTHSLVVDGNYILIDFISQREHLAFLEATIKNRITEKARDIKDDAIRIECFTTHEDVDSALQRITSSVDTIRELRKKSQSLRRALNNTTENHNE